MEVGLGYRLDESLVALTEAEESPKPMAGRQSNGAAASGARTVFVSYASQDIPIATAIVESLERFGVSCWIAPRDVVPGSLYADEIVGALNDARVVVLVLSQHSVASPHVSKEIERASSKRKRIVVMRTDAAPMTRAFEYLLSESQWIEVTGAGVSAAAGKLAEAVLRHLDPSRATESHDALSTHPIRRTSTSQRNPWLVAAGVVVFIGLAVSLGRVWTAKRMAREKPVAAAVTTTVSATPALNPTLPEAHIAAGKLKYYFHWDWQGADVEFKRALELGPRNADALKWEGYIAAKLGRLDDAVRLGGSAIIGHWRAELPVTRVAIF